MNVGLNPEVFHRANGQSAVHNQPTGEKEQLVALRAAVTCPTGSIRTENQTALSRAAADSFPLAATDHEGKAIEGVYFNGFTSQNTFGALSWLILDPTMNVMVDCPRYSEPLAKQILELAKPNGVSCIMLTHRDDVYDNHRWAERLGAKRIIHETECSASQHTDDCELQLNDDDLPYELSESFRILHVPGHSRGSIALLHPPSRSLFSGDHCWGTTDGGVRASPTYCSYSWSTQCDSIEALQDYPFIHLWPGHGRPQHFKDDKHRKTSLVEAATRLRLMS